MRAGYNVVDLCGLWTTYGWPVDIPQVVDKDRERRIHQILKAAHQRNIKVICFPSGILNWGFDQILKANPGLGTDNKHEMNPLKEESWQWLYRVLTTRRTTMTLTASILKRPIRDDARPQNAWRSGPITLLTTPT